MSLASAFGAVLGLKRPLPDALKSREDLQIAEIQRRFYGDLDVPPEQFLKVWSDIAEAFEVPAGKIRPGDRFGGELTYRPVFGLTEEDMILGERLAKRMKEFGKRGSTPKLISADDYVRFLLQNR